MRELAEGVWQLASKPENNINSYVIGDVLIDSGAPWTAKSTLKQLDGTELSAHALTHAHFDHYGAAHAVCSARAIPLWVGELDADVVPRGKQIGRIPGLGRKELPAAKGHPVARKLVEGDEVAGFKVLFTPGHSPGHVSYWRESDRTLICGDVMWGMNPFTLRKIIRDPFAMVSPDPALNRDSARRLAQLEPELVLFGHGAPLFGPEKFQAAVAELK